MNIIRSRAPLRIGMAGGGTDLSPYCDTFGGAVLNFTIDRFAHAAIILRDDDKIVFEANDLNSRREFNLNDDLSSADMALHRGVYERMMSKFNGGVRVAMTVITFVDAPKGSGLGSSSALVVALVEAFLELFNAPLGEYDVARLAFDIERVDLKLAGGRQDQYAAAFGGLNFIEFLPGERVIVNPLRLKRHVRNELEASIMTCFSGKSRESANIILRQTVALNSGAGKTTDAMHQLKDDAIRMKELLFRGQIPAMAKLLNKSWETKKATAEGITNPEVERLYELAMAEGALGGKVSGAGGGGFLFFIVAPEKRFGIVNALRKQGALADPLSFTDVGAEAWRPEESN